jgi:hypothetical protein
VRGDGEELLLERGHVNPGCSRRVLEAREQGRACQGQTRKGWREREGGAQGGGRTGLGGRGGGGLSHHENAGDWHDGGEELDDLVVVGEEAP